MKSNFDLAKKFVDMKRNHNHESISGPGSHISKAKETITLIDKNITNLNIKSILDLGCGDWNWFKYIDTKNASYEGWDACEQLIKDNNKIYGSKNCNFFNKDIVLNTYPFVDLIICRDVLFHMPIDMGLFVVEKIKKSCNFFACTSFNDIKHNYSNFSGWGFYNINTNISPFNLENFLIDSLRENNILSNSYYRYINLYAFNS